MLARKRSEAAILIFSPGEVELVDKGDPTPSVSGSTTAQLSVTAEAGDTVRSQVSEREIGLFLLYVAPGMQTHP